MNVVYMCQILQFIKNISVSNFIIKIMNSTKKFLLNRVV